MSKQISLPIKNKDVEALLLWRDPKKSGAVLAGITLAYVVFHWWKISVLTLVANALLVSVMVAFLWNNVASITHRSGVPLPPILKNGISETDAKAFAVRATDGINTALAYVRRLASGKDVFLSLQAAAVLFLVAKIGARFTILGLTYAVTLLAFTIPKVYELKKDEIDEVSSKVYAEGKYLYAKYAEPYLKKIPRASTSTGTPSAGVDTVPVVDKKAQ